MVLAVPHDLGNLHINEKHISNTEILRLTDPTQKSETPIILSYYICKCSNDHSKLQTYYQYHIVISTCYHITTILSKRFRDHEISIAICSTYHILSCYHNIIQILSHYTIIYHITPGWWFGTFFPIQLGMSSSQLMKSYFFRGVGQPPTCHYQRYHLRSIYIPFI